MRLINEVWGQGVIPSPQDCTAWIFNHLTALFEIYAWNPRSEQQVTDDKLIFRVPLMR